MPAWAEHVEVREESSEKGIRRDGVGLWYDVYHKHMDPDSVPHLVT